MKNRVIILSLLVSFFIILVSGENCDQKQIDRYVNTSQFENAAICFKANKDYDNAISYFLKSIEITEKSSRNDTGLVHIMIAECYSKKGIGFDKEIKQQCDLAEPLLLERIKEYLSENEPLYGSTQADYVSLADCYHLLKDKEKACEYCANANEYVAKAKYGSSYDCSGVYDCPKEPSNPISLGSSSSTPGGFPTVYLVVGGGLILIALAALFLLKKKK
jgi:tetratricopeptide (TPR) repeat protein